MPAYESRMSCATDWVYDLEEVVGADKLLRAASLIETAGFAGVQVHVGERSAPEALAELLRSHAPRCTGLTLDLAGEPQTDRERIRAWCGVVRSLELPSLSVRTGERRRHSVESWASFGADLLSEGTLAGLEVVNRCGSRFESPSDFHELLVRLDDPRITVGVDAIEFHRASVNPCSALGELSERVRSLVLADAVGNRQVPLGSGELNVRSILERACGLAGLPGIVCNPRVSSWSAAADELRDEQERLGELLEGAYTPARDPE